ncbi:MAG: ion transporter [Lachnospiraceae bacterium]|nr:ion transporter [Lachnospiraceae bacterium]
MDIKYVKKRIFDIIQIGTQVDIPSTIFDIFISCMILLSIVVTFLQTFDELSSYRSLLNHIEFFTIVVFIVEYALRLYTSDLLYPGKEKAVALASFVFSFYGLIDLLTILSYFSVLFADGIVALRIIRVVRIMRLFKVNQGFDAFNVVAEVILEKKDQIIFSMFMIATLMLAASLCMYSLEHDAQPDKFNNAFSGIWWAMSTLLTVGYGDIYPVTLGGRIAAIFIALLGVCAVAIPTGVISAGFVEYYTRLNRSGRQIELAKDIGEMVSEQAAEMGLDEQTYVERLVLQRDWERKAVKREEENIVS